MSCPRLFQGMRGSLYDPIVQCRNSAATSVLRGDSAQAGTRLYYFFNHREQHWLVTFVDWAPLAVHLETQPLVIPKLKGRLQPLFSTYNFIATRLGGCND
jgi:hypothetical protein